ncbi:hypothetical protein Nepgr_033246 [Nepenthes gracilis]|uniref:DUF2062 domain-containing protein n=1 Tax=Nepenthes gracilis TaxID=150966 RepID=A0AAD3TLY0_NEPGR|nr:hypothetical protein Nepgr_033246 [Nepenthes gracilis]
MPTAMMALAPWFHRRIVDPLRQILRRGTEPKQLAFSAALGFTLGIFPICGVTVFLCVMAVGLLESRCHSPTVMLANFVATPIELSLVIPFLRFGEAICGSPHFPLTSDALKKVLSGQASREVLLSIIHALLGWLIAAPFILGMLYVMFFPCFKFLVHKFNTVPSSPRRPLYTHPEVRLKVTFREAEAAMRACVDATPIIDGRRANCNLASLGVQRSKPSTPKHAAAGAGRNLRVMGNSFQSGYGGGGVGAAFPAMAATFPHYGIQQGIPFATLYGYSTYNSPDYSYPTSYYGMYGGETTQFPVYGAAGGGSMMGSAATGFYPYVQFGEGSGGTAGAYSTAAGQTYSFHFQPHRLFHYSSSSFPQHYGPPMSLAPTIPMQSGMTTMAVNGRIPRR